jgi:hypothetical protein
MGETIAGMEPGSSRTSSRTRVRAGQLLPGVDGRSVWLRRCKAILAAHLRDVPDPNAAERSILRRAATLTVELERMEVKFATAGEASVDDLDVYQRVANSLRRLLESVGLERRMPVINEPSLADICEDLDAGN